MISISSLAGLTLHDLVGRESRVRKVILPINNYYSIEFYSWEIRKDQILFIPSNFSQNVFAGVADLNNQHIRKIDFTPSSAVQQVIFLKEDFYLKIIHSNNLQYKMKTEGKHYVSSYYGNMEAEKIMRGEEMRIVYSIESRSLKNCLFDQSYMVESLYNVENHSVSIKQSKISSLKEIILHFLLHLNEDFDDDLLSDALKQLDLE